MDWCPNWREQEMDEPDVAEIVGSTTRAREMVDAVRPKHLAPVFALAGLAGAILPMIQEVLSSSGMS